MSAAVRRRNGETFAGHHDLAVVECGSCGVLFAMPAALQRKAVEDHDRWFWCPNGDKLHYTGETRAQKLEHELKFAQREAGWLVAERDQAKASLSAQKGVTTKLKKRIAAGVCPVCKRSFHSLTDHMAHMHPDYPPTEAAADERP